MVVGDGLLLATLGFVVLDSLGAVDCSARAIASCTVRGCDGVGALSAKRRCTADVCDGVLALATVGLGAPDALGAVDCSARTIASCTVRGCDDVGALSMGRRCTSLTCGALLTLATVGLFVPDALGAVDCSARAIASCTVRGCDGVGALSMG